MHAYTGPDAGHKLWFPWERGGVEGRTGLKGEIHSRLDSDAAVTFTAVAAAPSRECRCVLFA